MIIEKGLDCTACGACENICPVEAISMKSNEKGFFYPYIDQEKCLQCGKCEEVCPLDREQTFNRLEEPRVYALKSRNSEIRWRSTSGGAFSELAQVVLRRGGCVAGAAYREDWSVCHEMISEEYELEKLRRSKYQQSEIGRLFQAIQRELENGREVLFCGTPCQVGGLRSFLQKDYETLYLCDFICRAVSSPLLFQKYLQELQDSYHSEVDTVWMKNKCKGWHQLSTVITFKDGQKYIRKGRADSYVRLLLLYNMGVRSSCYSCQFKGEHGASDITLGDFWGLEHLDFDDNQGTSVVLCRTKKGLRLAKQILSENEVIEQKVSDVARGNPCLFRPLERRDAREDEFFQVLNASGYAKAYQLAMGENRQQLQEFDEECYQKLIRGRSVYIWGTGACAQQLLSDLPMLEIEAFIDNHASAKRVCIAGNLLPVVSPEMLPDNLYIIVASTNYYEEIKEQLRAMGKVEQLDFIIWTSLYTFTACECMEPGR